jgi:hypothetical protein
MSAAFIRKRSAMRGIILPAVELSRTCTHSDRFAHVLIHLITSGPGSLSIVDFDGERFSDRPATDDDQRIHWSAPMHRRTKTAVSLRTRSIGVAKNVSDFCETRRSSQPHPKDNRVWETDESPHYSLIADMHFLLRRGREFENESGCLVNILEAIQCM